MLLTDYIDDHSEMFTLWEFQSNENISYQIEQKNCFAPWTRFVSF